MPLHRVIFSSITARALPNLSRDTLITLSAYDSSGFENGGKVMAEKALDAMPSIINLIAILYFPKLTKSSGKKDGVNSFSINSASAAPTLKLTRVPALPKTASLTISSICVIYW